jgi:hypothetical protein
MGNKNQSEVREKYREALKYGEIFIEIDSKTFNAGEKV